MKDINKIIEMSAACGVQLGTLLMLKISVTAARNQINDIFSVSTLRRPPHIILS
jgi:hypothetical protein